MRSLRILLSAAVALSASFASASDIVIIGNKQDSQLEQVDDVIKVTSTSSKQLRAGDGGKDLAVVFLFALPELEPNETISSASLSLGLLKIGNSPNFNLDLYGLGYRADAAVLTTDFFEGEYGTDPNATAIQAAFMNGSSPEPSVITSTPEGAASLAGYLTDLYEAGAAGNFLALRLSNDVLNAGNYNYFDIAAANYTDDAAMLPMLTITTVPEPSTTAALLGAAAFGLVVLRRRMK